MTTAELRAQYPHTDEAFAHAVVWARCDNPILPQGYSIHLIELVSYSLDTPTETHCIAVHRTPHDPDPFVLPFRRAGLEMVLQAIEPLSTPLRVAQTLHALVVEFGHLAAQPNDSARGV